MKQCRICLDTDSCNLDWRDPDCEYMNCTEFKKPPLTNADRIRAMSDEELSVFLERVADGCDSCPILEECAYTVEEMSEEQIRLKWLKQECET